MEGKMVGDMNDIEMKKMGVQKAILSLLVEWKDLEGLLDFSTNTTSAQMLSQVQCEAQGSRQEKLNVGFVERLGLGKNLVVSENPMSDKQTVIDLIQGPSDNLAKHLEIEQRKLKERWEKLVAKEKEVGRVEVLCEARCKEIEGKVREIEFSKTFIGERARELELKQKELDDGFRELEVKKKKFTLKADKVAAKLIEIEKQKLKERWERLDSKEKEVERVQVLCEERFKEIEDRVREVESSRIVIEERAKELELKQKELDDGFTELESKKKEFAEKTNKFADINMNQTKRKRKRSSYNMICSSSSGTSIPQLTVPQLPQLPAPQVYETFWTCCTSCTIMFKYDKVYLNKLLKCNTCSRLFTAYELDVASVPQIYSSHAEELFDCPSPEFTDFDKNKDEQSFSVDQIWACYDSIDAMPILYGRIRKVFSPGFKLQVTFLKAYPEEQNNINWVKAGLPVVCGKFIHDDTIETSRLLMFSHQIHFEKNSDEGTYLIYPRKGETWALFKDWNIGWSSVPANHRTFKYVIVEILSDFHQETGIQVCYLAKVKRFVSVFRRAASTFLIPSGELLRFSHSIPSSKLSGAERGVPLGAFELDPASLPLNPDKFWQPEEMGIDA